MRPTDALSSILADSKYDDPQSEDTRSDAIEREVKTQGWEPVFRFLQELLENVELKRYWGDAIIVIWGEVMRGRSFDPDRVIAILCRCQKLNADLDGNLIWSIVSKLKKVGYLSKYDPLQDPGVLRELARWSMSF
jgi:hypothetical protein